MAVLIVAQARRARSSGRIAKHEQADDQRDPPADLYPGQRALVRSGVGGPVPEAARHQA